MNLNTYITAWNKAHIHLVDVRHTLLQPGDELLAYRLPTPMFVLAASKRAIITLDRDEYVVNGSYLIHGIKGQQLSLIAIEAELDCYMILYRVRFAFHYRRSSAYGGLLSSAMREPYAFAPGRFALLQEKAEKMNREWGKKSALAQIYAKGLFYQLVYDVMDQLQGGDNGGQAHEVAEQIVRYLQEHYTQPIGLDDIAARFHYSSRYVSKLFKRHTGGGIIEYMISLRIRLAQKLLATSNVSIQDVALSVGYSDLFYFTRIFKKHTGLSPSGYRLQAEAGGVYSASNRSELSIEHAHPQVYSKEGNENHSRNRQGEREIMLYRNRSVRAASLLLVVTMVLAACGGAQVGNGSSTVPSGSPTASVAPVQTQTPAESGSQAAEQAFPRTYVDSAGNEVIIKERPERVAVGHFAEMEYFFALGVPPIASPLADEILQDFEVTLGEHARDAKVTDLGDVMSINLEKLLEQEPDLFIGSIGLHDDLYNELSQIAPVVMLDLTGSWKESLTEYALIIGQEDKAKAYIDELTSEMKQANEELASFREESVGFFRISGPHQFGVMGTIPYGYFFDVNEGLGLQPPANYPEKWEVLSLEGLSEMNPDHIVLAETAGAYEQKLEELGQSNVWNGLRAVQNGNVHFLDLAAATNGPFAIKYAVKTIKESFLKQ